MVQLDWKMGQIHWQSLDVSVCSLYLLRVHPLELHFFLRNNWKSLEVRAGFITTKIRRRKHSDSNSKSRRDAAGELPPRCLLSIRFEHPDSHQLSMWTEGYHFFDRKVISISHHFNNRLFGGARFLSPVLDKHCYLATVQVTAAPASQMFPSCLKMSSSFVCCFNLHLLHSIGDNWLWVNRYLMVI